MIELSRELKTRLNRLKKFEKIHKEIGKQFLFADDGNLYPFDLMAIAALNRSMANLAGFILMLKTKNLICAGVLLRTQIDSAMRLHAASIVDNPHDLAMKVLRGEHIRRIKGRDGICLTDKYLVESVGKQYDWVPRVYQKTSGYIHLSDVHMFSTASPDRQQDSVLTFKMSPVDKRLPDDIYLEAIDAFSASTDMLLDYLRGWALTKELRPKYTDEEWVALREQSS